MDVDPTAAAVAAAVADAHRREWAFVLAATVRVTRDLDLAEECVQDAYARALDTWGPAGIPARPGAWLTTVARRRALDLLRRDATARRALPLLVTDPVLAPRPELAADEMADELAAEKLALNELAPSVRAAGELAGSAPGGPGPVSRAEPETADDRLRLVFTCCHPALGTDAQVALSLRLLCGLSTAEVARAFLVSEATMAARITRAKKKIAAARIPYRVPPRAELPARVDAVLTVVHLMFSTGYAAPTGDELMREDLAGRSLDLARMLCVLLPGHGEVAGLLALILLTDARRAARVDEAGRLVLLADQDRTRWDTAKINEGVALVRQALGQGGQSTPGRFAVMAAIAAVHDEAPHFGDTDWPQIVGLYDLLMRRWPSPVVALNRAVAVGFAEGPAEGLAALDALGASPELAGYGYLSASRADFLRRLGRTSEARLAYEEALLLTGNAVERDFLAARLDQLGS
jgi:RNA polymerase sigma factor (sigma-70 family)